MKKIALILASLVLIHCGQSSSNKMGNLKAANTPGSISSFTLSIPSNPAAAGDDKISYSINVSKVQGNLGVKVLCAKAGVKDPINKTSTVDDEVLSKSIEIILSGKAIIKSEPAKFSAIRGHLPATLEYEAVKADKTKQNVKVSDPVIYEGSTESIALLKLTALAYEMCHT